MADPQPLEDVIVVQYGYGPAIDFAGWLFAQHGATVCAPAGQPVTGPAAAQRDFCRVGKCELVASELAVRLTDADVVLAAPDHVWETVPARALTGTVTPFGDVGEYAAWTASEIALASLGGASSYTDSAAGVPVFGLGQRYQYLSGWLLYTALVAQMAGGRQGGGTRPDVVINVLETVVYLLPYATLQVAYNGSSDTLEHSGPRFVVPCRDGHVAVYAGSNWPGYAELLCRPDLRDDARFVTTGARFANVAALEGMLADWCRERSVAEVESVALRHSVAISRLMTVEDVLDDELLAEAGMWQPAQHAGRQGWVPRLPYRLDGARPGVPA